MSKSVIIISRLFLFKAPVVIVFPGYVMPQCFGEPVGEIGLTGVAIRNRLIHGVMDSSIEDGNSFISRARIIQP
jgi:hypothetical protein